MAKKMLIDATHAEETRVVVVDGNRVEEFDFETVNKRQIAGNIYLAKVTRVEPSLQAAFIDYGGNRHGFLAFAEIHPDYYQIPVADRKALIEEERAYAAGLEAEEAADRTRRPRRQERTRAESTGTRDKVATADAEGGISGMDVVDLDEAEAEDDGEANGADRSQTSHAEAEDEAEAPYVAADHASDTDAEIESVAEEDVADEIQEHRKPRQRRYKIQEVVKVRQILLVQVVKEERGNKGAALTTYLSLPGRYCVLMPNTARGGGISRKITNVVDRKKLKEIAGEMAVPEGAGLIIRTAGSQRTKSEIRRDYEYLMRLWEQIRDLTLKSTAPVPIYEEGDLIKRTIRDLYTKEIDEVLVEGEAGYRAAKDFMRMIMPSHARHVKLHAEQQPLFARFQVESYLSAMFNPTVQLKSGGYIVIGVTEALVAIDVNSGRATKEGSIEDTATKTNLEAAEEVARQLRLRDLAGLIVIDFIDMEERKNNAAVEKKLKEALKTDRARIQVGRISGFGLLEMSRQRLRPGMLESTTQPCAHCHGTGLIRSDDSMALTILRQIEEEGTRKRSREVLLKAPVAVVNFLMNQKREHVAGIEARYAMSVRIEADPSLISPDFTLEKFKTATRVVPEAPVAVISASAALMGDLDDEDIVEDEDEDEAEAAAPAAEDRRRDEPRGEGRSEGRGEQRGDGRGELDADGNRKKKRRRRRRRKPGGPGEDQGQVQVNSGSEESAAPDGAEPQAAGDDEAPRRARRTRVRKPRGELAEVSASDASEASAAVAETAAPETVVAEKPAPKPRRSRRKVSDEVEPDTVAAVPAATPEPEPEASAKKSPRARKPAAKPKAEAEAAPVAMPEPEVAVDAGPKPDPEAEKQGEAAVPKSKKRGWWSLGR